MTRVFNATTQEYVDIIETRNDEAEKAVYKEEKFKFVEKEIERILTRTDKYMLIDYPLTKQEKKEVLEYRQKLRDLSKQENYPDIFFPLQPKCIKENLEFN